MNKLARIESVPLREQWPDEAQDFTPWLASEEGMSLLGEALGMELEAEATEVSVGNYRADIVAVDTATGQKVVIENQLSPTDHDHIGKLITYAATVGASTVVWLAERVRQEHQRAVEWLNNYTTDALDFFAIEMELWSISGSPPAPRFSLAAKPDSFARAVRQNASQPTTGGLTYLEFWQGFVQFLQDKGSIIRRRKPQAQHWYDVAIGKSGMHLSLTVRLRDGDVACELYIAVPNAKDLFHALHHEADDIEEALGMKLEWLELPLGKASRIVGRAKIDANDPARWPEAWAWLEEQSLTFKSVLAKRAKELLALDTLPTPRREGE